MADQVLRLRDDESLRARIIQEGKKTARRLFDARSNGLSVLGVYSKLLGGSMNRSAARLRG